MPTKSLEIKAGSGENKILLTAESSEYQWLSVIEKLDYWLAEHSSVWIKEKVVFFRLMSTMIWASMSLNKSLEVLKDQTTSVKFANILKKIIQMIENWIDFSTSMEKFPEVFSWSECWLIRAWEKSWKLAVVLKNLADQIEASAKLTSKIKSAIMYPVMMIIVVLWAITAIMIFVIPEIKKMFESMWAELPAMTVALISTSDFLVWTNQLFWINNTILVLMFLALLGFWFVYFKNTKKWERIYNLFMLRVPLFWSLIKKMVIAKFCRWLNILTWSWMSLINSLYLLSEMLWNEAYRLRVLRIISDVKQWLTMSQNMKKDVLYFPPMLVSMLSVWEETAQLEEVTKKVAEFYEEEVDTAVSWLMSLLEPMIIVIVWVVIWWIIVAVMMPILSISDLVK
jgi:type IV pilus assembly protein PilC